jgi:hypothetical protein
MLNKIFSKPVELQVGEQALKFYSIADFEFCLSGRSSVPSRKITEMVKFTPDQLKKEARTIKDIEKRFVSILSRSIEDPASINRAMRELDPLIFSQDHSWREIVSSLNTGGDDLNPFRRVALVKYMQYLSSRQEIIKYLYSEKKRFMEEPALREGEAPDSSKFKDTLILENTIFEPGATEENKDKEFERLPKGEVVNLNLDNGAQVDILLSKHACKLVAGDTLKFVDQAGRQYDLRKGRNIVGRDTISNIMIDPALRDVSRLHLVVEKVDERHCSLTDMSSHGTYVPSRYLRQQRA